MTNTREHRADQVQEGRRRRSDAYAGYDLRLEVPEHLKDPAYAYRWINDDKGRLHARTKQDDWDFVEDENIVSHTDEKNQNETISRIRREVGVTASGRPLYAYLCKKKQEYVEEDFQKEMALNKSRQAQVLKKQDAGGEGSLAKGDPAHSYVPKEIQEAIGITEQRSKIRRATPRD
jgi:hypothetical protein